MTATLTQLPFTRDDLRAVAEELYVACEMVEANHNTKTTEAQYAALLTRHGWDGKQDTMTFRMTYTLAALARARAMGLGGGK